MIEFSDGMKFDTSGELHAEWRSDGWYVVGGGWLIPVADEDEAEATISRMRERRRKKDDVSNDGRDGRKDG